MTPFMNGHVRCSDRDEVFRQVKAEKMPYLNPQYTWRLDVEYHPIMGGKAYRYTIWRSNDPNHHNY